VRCLRARARHLCSRAARASACRHYDRRARCSLRLGTAQAARPPRLVRVLQEAWPELRLRDDDSLRREPRWNAGRCARPVGRVPQRKLRWLRNSVLRRSASFSFLRHCEERSDEAIQYGNNALHSELDCLAPLAMTAEEPNRDGVRSPPPDSSDEGRVLRRALVCSLDHDSGANAPRERKAILSSPASAGEEDDMPRERLR